MAITLDRLKERQAKLREQQSLLAQTLERVGGGLLVLQELIAEEEKAIFVERQALLQMDKVREEAAAKGVLE